MLLNHNALHLGVIFNDFFDRYIASNLYRFVHLRAVGADVPEDDIIKASESLLRESILMTHF